MSFYFYPFVTLCLLLIGAAIVRPQWVYEFPYFMAITFGVFILPQAYSLYTNEWGGIYLETTLLMCSLCLACCWLGYLHRPHPSLLQKLNQPIDTARFLRGGIALVATGWLFMFLYRHLPEEAYSSQLTGIGTVYLFFGNLVYPGFAICLYCAIRERWVLAWIASAVAAIIPLQRAVFQGKREPTALFILTLGLTLFFMKNVKPPRILIVAVLAGAALIIPATGQYRDLANENGLGALGQIDFGEQLEHSMDEDAVSELKNATALIAATQATGDYQYGADYWNSLVFRFVPAQFVGKDLKESLMIGGVRREFGEYVERVLGFALPTGVTVTGMGDSFNQFGYFGCLFFVVLGYFFKSLWAATRGPNGIIAQVFYIQITTTAMRAVTHQTIDFLPGFIYSAIFIGAVAMYARERAETKAFMPPISPSASQSKACQ